MNNNNNNKNDGIIQTSNEDDTPLILSPRVSKKELIRLLESHPLPKDTNGKVLSFTYGTAGFRYDAKLLEGIMIRVGILAAYVASNCSSSVGLMITASHNDESYNGVKLSGSDGGMMNSEGEALAVDLANAVTPEDVLKRVVIQQNNASVVHVGHDTRVHSPALTDLAVRAARAMGATVYLHGVVSTPQLHYCTMMDNPQLLPALLLPPMPNVKGYYLQLATAYAEFMNSIDERDESFPLIVDCACGVGFPQLQQLDRVLTDVMGNNRRTIVPHNAPGEGPLNERCGSEFVQKQQQPPTWYNPNKDDNVVYYGASLDGDADRIVFFSSSPSNFILLDGDKIAALICLFLRQQLSYFSDECNLKLGVVQTAYANGSSTKYLKELPVEVRIAKTGVKHVHKVAHEEFDIGVYFEANGHGTVLFGTNFYNFIDRCNANASSLSADATVALTRLQLLPKIINQAVGDALSDLLFVDAILQLQQQNKFDNGNINENWNSLYVDLPSKQCKVSVPDRTMIVMNDNETACLSPIELQQDLDDAVTSLKGARCFVRPSGTENVVRVYAEASTTEEANELADIAVKLIKKHLCNNHDNI